MRLKVSPERIKQLRVRKGWTQEKLASKANLNVRTVQRIESDGFLSVQSLNALAEALALDTGELLVDENPERGVSYSPEEATQWVQSYARAIERIDRWRSYGWVGQFVFLLGAILMVSCMYLVNENLSRPNIFYVLLPGLAIGMVLAITGAFMARLSVRAEMEEKTLRKMTQLQIPPWLKFN